MSNRLDDEIIIPDKLYICKKDDCKKMSKKKRKNGKKNGSKKAATTTVVHKIEIHLFIHNDEGVPALAASSDNIVSIQDVGGCDDEQK